MPSLKASLAFLASSAAVLGATIPKPTDAVPPTPCTTGAPVVTAGYPIKYYAQATPGDGASVSGYEPEPRWAQQHLVGTYGCQGKKMGAEMTIPTEANRAPPTHKREERRERDDNKRQKHNKPLPKIQEKTKTDEEALIRTQTFGVPEPVETGFAYAQFKCEYYCQNQSKGGSFFVRADSKVGSYCDCYDELMDPETFINNNNQTLVGAWNAICRT
ncbi:hypothetical protein GGR58DRAFT_499522 [Xylaria digitata]|nr:hypothetical protein GGR58DRAFT_499522 [Xylaria digitata]